MWSCGVILYALLFGTLPFDDTNIQRLFSRIRAGAYNLPMSISDAARDLIPRMLAVDPMARITLPQIRCGVCACTALRCVCVGRERECVYMCVRLRGVCARACVAAWLRRNKNPHHACIAPVSLSHRAVLLA